MLCLSGHHRSLCLFPLALATLLFTPSLSLASVNPADLEALKQLCSRHRVWEGMEDAPGAEEEERSGGDGSNGPRRRAADGRGVGQTEEVT